MNSKLRRYLYFFTIFTFFLPTTLVAAEYRRLGQSLRSMTMGGTGIAGANDSSALFYNPAVLANAQTWWIDYAAILVEYSNDATQLLNDIQTGNLTLDTQAEKQEFLETYIGKRPYIRIDYGVNAVVNFDPKGYTFAYNYLGEILIDLETKNPVSPVITIFEQSDVINQIGMSIPLGVGKWVIGLGARTINRTSLEFDYGINEILTNADFPTLAADGLKGTGFGYDIGLIYRMGSIKFPTTIGLVAQNIGGIELSDAGKVEEEIAMGVTASPAFGPVRLVLSLDYRDITGKQGEEGDLSLNRRIHVGAELGILPYDYGRSLVSLRAGINQSYLSYGAEFALGAGLVAGYASYSQETGEYAGQKENKRKILYFSLGF